MEIYLFYDSLVVIAGKPITFQSPIGYHDAGVDSVKCNWARQVKTLSRI